MDRIRKIVIFAVMAAVLAAACRVLDLPSSDDRLQASSDDRLRASAILSAQQAKTDDGASSAAGTRDTSAAQDAGAAQTASGSLAASAAAYVPEDNRQPILSMGQEPGTIYISWKGTAKGPKYLRCSNDKYSLPVEIPLEARRDRILKGGYYRYTVRLSGLREGQIYYYEIGDGTAFDSPRFFYAPNDNGETVFAYLGDPQFDKSLADYEDWGALVWGMYKDHQDIEFAITGGDMVNIPTRESHWNGFLDNSGLFGMLPLMTIPGNHEGVTSNATYKKLFDHIDNGPVDEAFYYFDYGHCRFIMLDSSFLTKARKKTMGAALWSVREQEVEAWLRRTLSESGRKWNIVVTHHPVYGLHDIFTVSPEIRQRWLPIIEEEGADLVLCGHQHTYMRTRKIDGIVHVMGNSGGKKSNYYRGFNRPDYAESIYAAGSNYQIIKADRTTLEILSYNKDGMIIDSFRMKKSPWSRLGS